MDNLNPGAYQFVPGQGYVPTNPGGAPNAAQPGQPGQPAFNPYNPYAQQQQQQGGYYPQGGYGGYPQQQQYGGQGGYAGGNQYGGYQGYQQQQGQFGGAQRGGYQPPHMRQAQGGFQPGAQSAGRPAQQAAPTPAASAPSFQPSSTPFVPPAQSTGPAKTMSLKIGGASPAPASTGPAKTMSISIGGKKPALPAAGENKAPAKVISIGGKKPTPSVTPAASTTSTPARATTPAAPEEKKVDEPAAAAADWDDDSKDAAAPAPATKEAEIKPSATIAETKAVAEEKPTPAAAAAPAPAAAASGVAISTGKSNWTRQASKTDSDAIAKEAARVADEEMLKELYGGEEVDPSIKSHLNVVFIGHVDAGKSTLGGQLLYLCDMVDKRTMEKLEKEAKAAGRETWYLSWALDSTPQERSQGKTVEVGRAYFETPIRRYTILDAPGHKTYVPSMISGAAQADIAILVISARKGEFETGFERGGQTREHAMLVKNNGVNKIIVVVNKMDDPTVQWAKERFEEVVTKITPYLKSVGFNPKTDITFIPVSAYTGQNMKERVDKKIADWSAGPSLLEFLDNMPINNRQMNAPFMLPVSEKYNEMGTVVVGKIETGRVKKGDSLLLMPNKVQVDVAGVFDEQAEELPQALCGDNVRIRLRGISDEDVTPGFVLTSAIKPIRVATQFEAQLAIIESKNIICAGYSCVLHLHTLAEEVTLTALLHYYDKKTGRKSKKPPQFAKKGMRVVALIETTAPICIEKYADYPMLGRFTLRDEGKTIAIGKVTKIKEASSSDMPAVGDLSLADGTPAASAA